MKNATRFLVLVLAFIPAFANAFDVSFERNSKLPLVYLNVAIKAGAVSDPSGESGLTNFTGEMLLRGTKNKTKDQINLELDQMGAQLGVETRAEAMIIRGAVLSSQLDRFLSLVREIVIEPSFPETEIGKLKSEIVSGILDELGDDGALGARTFNRFLFQSHPYGNPILGTTQDIGRLTRAMILRHFDRLVTDRSLLVVGSGDADPSKIEAWAKGLAQARPNPSNGDGGLPENLSKPENAPTRRLLIVSKPDRTQTQINLGQIGVTLTDPNYFSLYVGNYAFGGGGFSSTLMKEIRVKRGWSYGAYSMFRHGLQPRSWQIHLFPASKDAANALTLSIQLVQNLKEQGITEQQFAFAQRSLINGSGFMFNTPAKRVENKLLEKTLNLPDGFMQSYGPRIQEVTLKEVNSAFKAFLKPDRLAIDVVATAKDLKPALAKAAGVPEDKVIVKPYDQED